MSTPLGELSGYLLDVGPKTETFTERFNRLTAGMNDGELAMTLDLSMAGLRKIREGQTQSLKLHGALRLCRKLRITAWELAFGEPEPAMRPVDDPLELLGDGRDVLRAIAALRSELADQNTRFANALGVIGTRLSMPASEVEQLLQGPGSRAS
jgi:DNA-binding Xre family transcriptional regulator